MTSLARDVSDLLLPPCPARYHIFDFRTPFLQRYVMWVALQLAVMLCLQDVTRMRRGESLPHCFNCRVLIEV